MWWPAFRSVVHDLWLFVLGRETTAALAYTGPAVAVASAVLPPAAPPVATPDAPTPPVVFRAGEHYGTSHLATQAVRTYLADHTSARVAAGPLTTFEWLVYLYTQSGVTLPWLALGLAPVGQWHSALRGLAGVSIGLVPRTRSLMEWTDAAGDGQIAYVTAVTPDEQVTVRALATDGVMHETTHSKSEWKELRPVFIVVS